MGHLTSVASRIQAAVKIRLLKGPAMVRSGKFGLFRLNPQSFVSLLLSISLVAFLPGCGGSSSKSTSGNGNPGVINHVVFMLQENRSSDNYVGNLKDLRVQNRLPADVDG